MIVRDQDLTCTETPDTQADYTPMQVWTFNGCERRIGMPTE